MPAADAEAPPLSSLSDEDLLTSAGAGPRYETQLEPQDEQKYASWKKEVAPRDSGFDYDFRGAFKAGVLPDGTTGHWPDTFKKPIHPTFSDQSIYAKDRPDLAGTWEGENYVSPKQVQLRAMSDDELAGIAVQEGLLQPDQATEAVRQKKQTERAPMADALAMSMAYPGSNVPTPVAKLMLTAGGRPGDIAAQVLAPIFGSIAGTGIEPGGGTIAGGAAGGVAGDALAQAREYFRGERDSVGKGELAVSGVLGAIPGGGSLLKTPGRVVATRAAQAFAIGTGAEATRQLLDEGKLDWKGIVQTGALSALFGAGAGGIEAIATRRSVLRAIRQTPEFRDFNGTDRELVQQVRGRMNQQGEAPPASAVEPRNVTPPTEPVNAGTIIRGAEETGPSASGPEAPNQPAPSRDSLPPSPVPSTSSEPIPAPPGENLTIMPTVPERPHLGNAPAADIERWASEATDFDKNITAQVFGDRAAEYQRLERQANSTMNPQRADAASAKMQEMEGQLTKEQQDRLYGMDLPKGYQDADAVRDTVRAVNSIDATRNVDELVTQNSRLIRDFIKASASREPLAPLQAELTTRLVNRAKELGATPQELVAKTLLYRSKFEGADAPELMGVTPAQLRDFLQTAAPEAEKISRGITGAPGESVSGADYQYTVQRPMDLGGGRTIPGYTQIDEIRGGKNTRSSNLESLRKEGVELPDVPGHLPSGRYTLQQIHAASQEIAEHTPPRTAAMGAAAPRPSAGHNRVQIAQAAARAAAQSTSGVAKSATTLATAVPAASPAKWFAGVRSVFAPQTLDAGAKQMSLILRAAFGREYEALQQADHALQEFRKEFDRTPVPRGWTYKSGQPLPRNYDLMARIDTGNVVGLTPAEAGFANVMRSELDRAITLLQQVSPNSLRELMEHYMPRTWKDPSKNQGKLNALLAHSPLEGPKSFLKKRTLEYFVDGLKLGLKPISDNPVDVVLQKLGEMARFTTARRAMMEAKQVGLRKFKYVYEQMPEGWRAADDPSSDVWKPPTVTIQEAYDAQMRAKTLEMLDSLGIPHERLTKLGGKRWGDANEQLGIRTKFAGPDFVFWHEAGHMLDWRFPELRKLTGAMDRGPKGNEMRALADLRFEGQQVSKTFKTYARKTEEKIANMFDAYIRAPDKFKTVAPGVWKDFTTWLQQHPEVKVPLDGIRPSLTLGSSSTEMFVGGPIKLGDWIMPEGAAQVLDNYLQPGLGRYAVFRGLRDVSGLQNGVQLLGFFHSQFVMNDSFYSGVGLALHDVMTGHPMRAAREIVQIPISPATSWWRGRKIQQAVRNPGAASLVSRQLAKMSVEANLRAGHGIGDGQMARQWSRAMRELRSTPSTGAAWESFWRTPFAAVETVLSPIMRYLVPPMKLGIFARMAERVQAENPGATVKQLREQLAEAADATEDRLGQVTYDNLFQNRVLKDVMQLALRAYGWQLTKYRMMAGGAADWGRAARDAASGKKPKVTFRMSYLPAMLIGHAILAAIVQYALTGKGPQKPTDYLFPDTGLKDKLGRPVRVSVADFVKDVAADWRSFPNPNKMGAEWTRKLAPFWNMSAEMYQNRDFWGTEIFSPRQPGEPELNHLLKNLGEGSSYLGQSAQPFSLRAGQKFADAGASPAVSYLAPLVGFTPAPRYAVETPMQNYLSEQAGRDQYTRTQAQAEEGRQARDISAALRERRPLTADQQTAMRNLSREQLGNATKRAFMDPDVWAIRGLDLDRAMMAWDLASKEEREKIAPTIRMKLGNAFSNRTHDTATLQRYLKVLNRP